MLDGLIVSGNSSTGWMVTDRLDKFGPQGPLVNLTSKKLKMVVESEPTTVDDDDDDENFGLPLLQIKDESGKRATKRRRMEYDGNVTLKSSPLSYQLNCWECRKHYKKYVLTSFCCPYCKQPLCKKDRSTQESGRAACAELLPRALHGQGVYDDVQCARHRSRAFTCLRCPICAAPRRRGRRRTLRGLARPTDMAY
mmetsp:Transcript_30398/g.79717  ORF Transcript_30398/g.79717 Transcript_30398/m.79717 type:complete len:196 (-) Transcript_30398:39-626(-)